MTRRLVVHALAAGALCFQASATAAEIKLVCLDMSSLAVKFRQTTPSIGVAVFAVDAAAGTVRQLEGEFQEAPVYDVRVGEAVISFVQDGAIAKPGLKETFRTSISRVSGAWVQTPHYLDGEGRWLSGAALEKVAHENDLAGPFFGIRRQPTQGECQVDARKF